MKMSTRLGAVAFAGLWATACIETPEEGGDGYGSIGSAITATGSDGATYRLPDDSGIQVIGVSPNTFNDTYSLDGDAATITVDVPVGSYGVYLFSPQAMGPDWQLERTNPDMTTETVAATLVTPIPVDVTVLENQTSNVVFQFQVADGGTVVFAQGSLSVSIDVDVSETDNGRASFVGSLTTDDIFVDGPVDPAFFPLVGEQVFQGVEVVVNGDWTQQSSTRVCAPAFLAGGSGSHQGPFDTLVEIIQVGGTSQLCLTAFMGVTHAEYRGERQGAPVSVTWSGIAPEIHWYKNTVATLPVQVFDGETLDLGALAGSYPAPAASFEGVETLDGTATYFANYSGPVSFVFTPAP